MEPAKSYPFDGLFVFEIANNHNGDVEHGLKIINMISDLVKAERIRGCIKFQLRDFNTIVHEQFRESDIKHIKRFRETRISLEELSHLKTHAKGLGLLTMCTPFDEVSAHRVKELGFDIIKIASCSAKDWPLIEVISGLNMPLICSTGALKLDDIDNIHSHLTHKAADFAMMHCVSRYPTPIEDCNLNFIEVLRRRFPKTTIGWSTHEDPSEMDAIKLAYAKGARIFERHVGIESREVTLNSYSSSIEQISNWLRSYKKAIVLLGSKSKRVTCSEESEIVALQRGIYVTESLQSGYAITRNQVKFAMPRLEGQLHSGEWRDGIILDRDLQPGSPLLANQIKYPSNSNNFNLKRVVHQGKALLNYAGIRLPSDVEIEYSHHYGLAKFQEYGAIIINCINREYCKKLILMAPGQFHPIHHHRLKEETFEVLYGSLTIRLDDEVLSLTAGQSCLVMPGVWHSFGSDSGCVIEELSTTHYDNDSIYRDPQIQQQSREQRKTKVRNWGRYEI